MTKVRIKSSELSVVIQGSLDRNRIEFQKCIDSVRENLPGSQIIVVTWAGEEAISEVDNIQIPDPGPEKSSLGYVSNLKRQIFGVSTGLERADRPYVLKLRPEVTLLDDRLLQLLNDNQNELIVLDSVSRAPWLDVQLFWISDLVTLGSRQNVLDYWSTTALQLQRFPKNIKLFERIASGYFGSDFVVNSEQTLAISYLLKRGVSIEQLPSGAPAPTFKNYLVNLSALESQFRIVTSAQMGITLPSRLTQESRREPILSRKDTTWGWIRRYLSFSFALSSASAILRHLCLSCWKNIRKHAPATVFGIVGSSGNRGWPKHPS